MNDEAATARRMVTIEIALISFLLLALIWFPLLVFREEATAKGMQIILGVGALVAVIVSWCSHKDDWDTVGLIEKTKKFWLLFVLPSVLFLIGLGLILNIDLWRQKGISGALPEFRERGDEIFKHLGYPFWALFQQLLAQGYLANRCGKIFSKPSQAALLVGFLFAVFHLPNPVLTPATFVFGFASSYYFLKYERNLYVIAFVHAILAVVLKNFITDDLLKHGMRVGPHYFE